MNRITYFLIAFVVAWLWWMYVQYQRHEILLEEFGISNMRGPLPASVAKFERIDDMLIVYQKPETYSTNFHFEDRYTVGVDFDIINRRYSNIFHVEGLNPILNFNQIERLSSFYYSDSTYLDFLIKQPTGKIEAIIYRKTDELKKDGMNLEYMIWKTEEVYFVENGIQAKVIEEVNQHMF